MRKEKLKYMPYAQAHVEIDDNGNKFLVSYVTTVLCLTADGWLSVNGLYSATTRRHIGAFMKEYTNYSYHTAKDCYWGDYALNLETGEIFKGD